MIHIDRTDVPALFKKFVDLSRQDLGLGREPQAPEGRPFINRLPYPKQIKDRLAADFNAKCGYCESPLGSTAAGGIDTFRPVGLYGDEARLDWSNLVYSCAICNRNKGDAFPLRNDSLHDQHSSYDERVNKERPVLLNPCLDKPSQHLAYERTGRIIGLSKRGMVTIELLDLNRASLIEAREWELHRFRESDDENERLLLLPNQPYLAIKQMFHRGDNRLDERVKRASLQQAALDNQRENVRTDIGEGLDDYKARPRYIESIRIENVGAIKNLTLDLTAKNSNRIPSFAMLGVNGVGKSTVLKAIAATLAGEKYAKELRITSNSLLSDSESVGSVTLSITGYSNPLTLTLRRGRRLEFGYRHSRALVLGYGATRLMATKRRKAKPGVRHAKLANLFDPFLPVSDPSTFLDNLSADRIEHVRATLDSLLNTEIYGDSVAVIRNRCIRFCVGGGSPRPVSELSDGYKALIAMASDIIDVMHRAQYYDLSDAKGIVLMDELGNHFHPAWKLRIVPALRRAFPRIQFIFSTHEPLCLRGLVEGEVAVLERDAAGVYLLTDLPAVESLRIDQLLTSEHFGLASTLDPAMNDKIQRYHILIRNTGRTEQESAELAQLEHDLTETKYLGNSQRERMLLQLLDLSLEPLQRPPGENVSVKKVSDRSLNRLKDILKAVGGFNPAIVSKEEL